MTDSEPIKIKLIILGNSNVGKTSLIRRFVDDQFVHNEAATIGFDFRPYQVKVDGELIQFNIWDTAGAERYNNCLTPSFYRHANGVLFVYDVTSTQSLSDVTYWVEQTEQYSGSKLVKMLVGNKIDLTNRMVSKQEGVGFARRIGALFVETSAKMSENVRDAFIELVRKILQDPEFRASQSPKGLPLGSSNQQTESLNEPRESSCGC